MAFMEEHIQNSESLNDDEQKTDNTNEILEFVLQNKSRFGERLRNFFRPANGQGSSSLSHQTDSSHKIDHLMNKYTPNDHATKKEMSCKTGTGNRYAFDDQTNYPHSALSLSTSSKMIRSVSTPEMNLKAHPECPRSSAAASSNIYRKLEFSKKENSSQTEINKKLYDSLFTPVSHKQNYLNKNTPSSRMSSLAENHHASSNSYSRVSNIVENNVFKDQPSTKESNRMENYVSRTPLCRVSNLAGDNHVSRTPLYRVSNLAGNDHVSKDSLPRVSNLAGDNHVSRTPLYRVSNLAGNDHVSKDSLPRVSSLAEDNHVSWNPLPRLPESTSNLVENNHVSRDLPPATTVSSQVDPHVSRKSPSKLSIKENHQLRPPLPPAAPASLSIEASDIISVNGSNYFKMGEFGKGGSSVVHEVLDLKTRQCKAIKIVSLSKEDEATRNSYKNEIKILRRLQYSPRIIKLFDYEETQTQLKIVMEVGQIDLSKILSHARQKNSPISPYSIQHYWQGMLLAVQVIHEEGIIHSDLKPANFLLVNETLKLIDFGIASSVQQDMTSVFKDSQAGTYNYMSPESLNDVSSGPIINSKEDAKTVIKIGLRSDVWSLGCILYNLVYGRTPFHHIKNPLQKLAAISNPSTKISFPTITDKQLLDVMQQCLQFDPYRRPTIKELLSHPYLNVALTPKPGADLLKADLCNTSQKRPLQ